MKEDIEKIMEKISRWRSHLRSIKCGLCCEEDADMKAGMFDLGVLFSEVNQLEDYLDEKYEEKEEEENG